MEMMSLSALAATHPLSAVLATIKANSSANARALSDEQYSVIAQHLDEFPKGSVKLLGKTFGARPPKDVAVLTKLAMAFPLEMLDNARDLPESVQKMLITSRDARQVIAQSLTNGSLNLSEFKSYDDAFAATLISVLSGSSYRNAAPLVLNLFNTGELEKALKSGAVTPKESVSLLGNYANVLFKVMTENDVLRMTQAVVNAQDAEDSLTVKDKLVAIATAQNVKVGAMLKTKLTTKQAAEPADEAPKAVSGQQAVFATDASFRVFVQKTATAGIAAGDEPPFELFSTDFVNQMKLKLPARAMAGLLKKLNLGLSDAGVEKFIDAEKSKLVFEYAQLSYYSDAATGKLSDGIVRVWLATKNDEWHCVENNDLKFLRGQMMNGTKSAYVAGIREFFTLVVSAANECRGNQQQFEATLAALATPDQQVPPSAPMAPPSVDDLAPGTQNATSVKEEPGVVARGPEANWLAIFDTEEAADTSMLDLPYANGLVWVGLVATDSAKQIYSQVTGVGTNNLVRTLNLKNQPTNWLAMSIAKLGTDDGDKYMFTLGRPESSLDPVKAIVGKNTASHLLSDHVNAGWAYIVRNMIDALGPHYKEISDSKVPQDAPTEILLAAGVADEKAANEPVAGKYQGQSTEMEKRDKVMRGEIVIMSSAELDAWIESADGMPSDVVSAPNPQQVGTEDNYVVGLKNTNYMMQLRAAAGTKEPDISENVVTQEAIDDFPNTYSMLTSDDTIPEHVTASVMSVMPSISAALVAQHALVLNIWRNAGELNDGSPEFGNMHIAIETPDELPTFFEQWTGSSAEQWLNAKDSPLAESLHQAATELEGNWEALTRASGTEGHVDLSEEFNDDQLDALVIAVNADVPWVVYAGGEEEPAATPSPETPVPVSTPDQVSAPTAEAPAPEPRQPSGMSDNYMQLVGVLQAFAALPPEDAEAVLMEHPDLRALSEIEDVEDNDALVAACMELLTPESLSSLQTIAASHEITWSPEITGFAFSELSDESANVPLALWEAATAIADQSNATVRDAQPPVIYTPEQAPQEQPEQQQEDESQQQQQQDGPDDPWALATAQRAISLTDHEAFWLSGKPVAATSGTVPRALFESLRPDTEAPLDGYTFNAEQFPTLTPTWYTLTSLALAHVMAPDRDDVLAVLEALGQSSYDGVAQGPSQLHIGFFGMSEGQFAAQFTIDLGIDGENHRITLDERYDVVDDQDTIVQLCSLVSMLYAGTDPEVYAPIVASYDAGDMVNLGFLLSGQDGVSDPQGENTPTPAAPPAPVAQAPAPTPAQQSTEPPEEAEPAGLAVVRELALAVNKSDDEMTPAAISVLVAASEELSSYNISTSAGDALRELMNSPNFTQHADVLTAVANVTEDEFNDSIESIETWDVDAPEVKTQLMELASSEAAADRYLSWAVEIQAQDDDALVVPVGISSLHAMENNGVFQPTAEVESYVAALVANKAEIKQAFLNIDPEYAPEYAKSMQVLLSNAATPADKARLFEALLDAEGWYSPDGYVADHNPYEVCALANLPMWSHIWGAMDQRAPQWAYSILLGSLSTHPQFKAFLSVLTEAVNEVVAEAAQANAPTLSADELGSLLRSGMYVIVAAASGQEKYEGISDTIDRTVSLLGAPNENGDMLIPAADVASLWKDYADDVSVLLGWTDDETEQANKAADSMLPRMYARGLTIKQGRPNNRAGATVIPGRTVAPPRGGLPQMPAAPTPAAPPVAPAPVANTSPDDIGDDNLFGDSTPAAAPVTGGDASAEAVAALDDVGAPSAALNDTIGTLMVDLLDNADENTTWLDVAKQLRTAVLADPVAAADLPEGSDASQLRAILNGMGVQPEQYQAAALD